MGEHDRCSNLGESRRLSSVSLYSKVELVKHWAVCFSSYVQKSRQTVINTGACVNRTYVSLSVVERLAECKFIGCTVNDYSVGINESWVAA